MTQKLNLRAKEKTPALALNSKSTLDLELKYQLYEASVQNPKNDAQFIQKEFQKFRNRRPLVLREDFAGTAKLCCFWAKMSPNHIAYGVDLDKEPIEYGVIHHQAKLTAEQKKRVTVIEGDVLHDYSFKSDITVAFNFSYFLFKQRKELLEYFKKAYQGLNKDGMFVLDMFGGTEAMQALEEQTKHPTHSYFWDCKKYNPLTQEVLYAIHFKHKSKKYLDVFTYDWRMWGPTEVKEILVEAGFKEVHLYWEGETATGEGNGRFKSTLKAENCPSWVIYISALK